MPNLENLAARMSPITGQTYEKTLAALSAMPEPMVLQIAERLGIAPIDRKVGGRPRSAVLNTLRAAYPNYSPRTIARMARAFRLLTWAEVDESVREDILTNCTRPSGSFNVAAFEAEAEARYWLHANRQETQRGEGYAS